MPNLTETAYWTRKIIKLGTIGLVVFIIAKTAFNFGRKTWQRLRPPPPPAPTVSFGKLPKPAFPEETPKTTNLIFRLETIQGGLPALPEIGQVYFIPKAQPNLLALERAKQAARKMGFTSQPEPANSTEYRWTTASTPPTVLTMDINTNNFQLRYQYENDPEILLEKNLPSDQQAAQEAKNFLNNNDLLHADLANGTAEFDHLRFTPPSLTPATSVSEADFVRVNLFRADLNALKILPANPKKSSISFLFSGSRKADKRMVEIVYTYFSIEAEIFATYPLRTVSQAWNQLQSGKGYLANLGQNQNEITIRRVYLSLYDPAESQHYLQPIFVFEGDRDFYAYVPAVSEDWLE